MKYLRENPLALILTKNNRTSFSKISLYAFCLIMMFNLACSHKFVKLENTMNAKIINMTLCVKLYNKDKMEKFTVYAQVDRENMHAILDGIGKFDKYVFHMDINGDKFYFEDYVNKEKKSGILEEFEEAPLTQNAVFKEIDISKPQPIIFKSDKQDVRIEIVVKEQK